MSEILSNKDINDIMLIDLANKELRQDIKLCLMLISSKKQHSFDFKKFLCKALVISFSKNI